MIPFVVVFVGLFCIFAEFYLPGGIMAAVGSLLLLMGAVLYADSAGSLLSLAAFIAGTCIAVVLVIYYALRYIVRTKASDSFYSARDQEGFLASTYDANAVGKIGVVLSDLKPGGFILVDGKKQPAVSVAGYITKGKKVRVLSGREQTLTVAPEEGENLDPADPESS